MRRPAARLVFACASVLLDYPDEDLAAELSSLGDALDQLPAGRARTRLQQAHRQLAALAPLDAAADYVATFDLRRRRSLHLTWYRHGDTRERGMALAALADAYRRAGVRLVPGELPDFLPALLELAAHSPAGATVLAEHRPAIDALHVALADAHSPYADVVAAVTDALGSATRADRVTLRRYRSQEPPSERVGLEPFAPPEIIDQGVTQR